MTYCSLPTLPFPGIWEAGEETLVLEKTLKKPQFAELPGFRCLGEGSL
jgi:hypothetical protein